jgi:hypothetical protein
MGFCTITTIQGLSIYSEFSKLNPKTLGPIPDNTVLYEFEEDEYFKLKIHLDAINRMEGGFKWALLPKSENSNIRKLVEGRNYEALLALHDKYKLSNYPWACCGLVDLYEKFEEYLITIDE